MVPVVLWQRLTLLLLLVTCCARATIYRRSLADYPRARCNDGTSGVYYSSMGSGDGNNFVIYLQGGGYCHTAELCELRCDFNPNMCTARTDLTKGNNGILSDNPLINPHFHDWFKVELHYCTSDLYIGNRTASNETAGFHFRGRDVLTSMIEDLKQNYGLGSGESVILTGSSAGGAGTAFLCDHVRSLLPNMEVWCIVDAALFYPPIPPFSEGCETMNEIIDTGNDFWYGDVEGFDVFSWWEEFELPLMIGIPLWDTFGIGVPYCGTVDPDHLSAWAAGMEELIEDVSSSHPEIALFVPGCLDHSMINNNERFAQVLVGENNVTYSDHVDNWYSHGSHDVQVWDECDPDAPVVCNPTCAGPVGFAADVPLF